MYSTGLFTSNLDFIPQVYMASLPMGPYQVLHPPSLLHYPGGCGGGVSAIPVFIPQMVTSITQFQPSEQDQGSWGGALLLPVIGARRICHTAVIPGRRTPQDTGYHCVLMVKLITAASGMKYVCYEH